MVEGTRFKQERNFDFEVRGKDRRTPSHPSMQESCTRAKMKHDKSHVKHLGDFWFISCLKRVLFGK